jgi:hypothetical protein
MLKRQRRLRFAFCVSEYPQNRLLGPAPITDQILAGAVPAACIALAADGALGWMERRWSGGL